MVNLKYIWTIIIFTSGISMAYTQQLPQWSTYYENGFIWNPALTAKWNFWEVTATHRKEWTGFQNAPTYTTLGFQFPFIERFTTSCVGAFISNDEVGPYRNLMISGTYAYKIKPQLFDNWKDVLTFGIGARFQQISFSPSSFTVFDPYEVDPMLVGESFNSVAPNLSVGIFYNSVTDFYTFKSHYYGGIAVTNFIPSRLTGLPIENIQTAPHINIHAGFRHFPFRKKHYFEPSILITYVPLKAYHVIAHMRFEQVDQYWLAGGVVSNGEAFMQVGLVLTEDSFAGGLLNGGVMRIGFKADYSIGKIRKYAGVGYEVYLAYQFELE